jgi:FtsP/CotA-like multicopper oxidase with cupredoxin domain
LALRFALLHFIHFAVTILGKNSRVARFPRAFDPQDPFVPFSQFAGQFMLARGGRDLLRTAIFALALFAFSPCCSYAQQQPAPRGKLAGCPRPAPGSIVTEPDEIRSHNGLLKADLTYLNFTAPDGQEEYCYLSKNGGEAPTLRVKPGDLLILHLKNELTEPLQSAGKSGAPQPSANPASMTAHMAMEPMHMPSPCAGATMTALSTNLHFHGLTVPPTCHQDDVLRTAVQPGAASFEYRFRIPADEAPGLYWYHPHVHGYTNVQVLGGASGALIVEGIERANRLLAGLPERLFVIRDQELLNPNAQPVQSGNVPPPIVLRDPEGDILNTGTGGGKPAKDLSINFIPVPFPEYPPAQILVRTSAQEFWRVLNASAITYLDLQLLVGNSPQPLGVVALDGIPINENGMAGNRVIWESHILLPPAGRAEFIFKGLPKGARASFVTRTVDTGPAGENDPTRPLATIAVSEAAPESASRLTASPSPLPRPTSVWLGDVKPVRTRKLYFSEIPQDPKNPNSPTVFMLTVEGQPPVPYDPNSKTPNITVQQGDVEDWIIENRTQELHAFHIHQIHFLLTEWNGVPVDEPFLRDTVNVAYWDGKSPEFPRVKLRMDFRDPNSVGTFVYHCHLLEHEDGGMMGTILVKAKASQRSPSKAASHSGRLQNGTLQGSAKF